MPSCDHGDTNDSPYAPTERLTPFLWRKRRKDDPAMAYYLHWCPACKHGHTYPTGGISSAHNWAFDENFACPSFNPSMHIFVPAGHYGDRDMPQRTICHYYLTAGRIIYQGDCRHSLAGQSVAMEPIPEDYGF